MAATVAARDGYDVEYYDLRFGCAHEAAILATLQSGDVICLTGSPDAYAFIRRFAAEVKRRYSNVPIIVGGCAATISWKTLLSRTAVDYCLRGECEESLPTLLEIIAHGKEPANIPAAFKKAVGFPVTGVQPSAPAVNNLPAPDYGLWLHNNAGQFPRTICYSTQRGCRAGCSFCANPSRGMWRPVSPAKVLRELSAMKELGLREVWFNDPSFNTDEGHCRAIAAVMAKAQLPWACSIRSSIASRSLFQAMRDSGCTAVFLGVESAADTVLGQNNKNITVADTEACLAATEAVGLPTVGFLLLGLPGESDESLSRTVKFARAHSFVPRPRFAVPYPGTALFDEYIKANQNENLSPEQIEEDILLRMSSGQPEGRDGPMPLPNRRVSTRVLQDAMTSIMNIAATRKTPGTVHGEAAHE